MIAQVAHFSSSIAGHEATAVHWFRERLVPVLQAQPGFRGHLVLVSARDAAMGVTLWDTEQDARLAWSRLEQERRTGADAAAVDVPVFGLYDVVGSSIAASPSSAGIG